MSKNTYTEIGKSILEFRYDPIISFSDWKSTLAEFLIEKLGLDGFKISDKRIDLIDLTNQDFMVFVTMQNAGLVFENNVDKEKLKEKTKNFIETLYEFEKFKTKNIVRFGIRLNNLKHKKNVTLQKIKETFENHVIKLNQSIYANFDEKIVDIGLPLNFRGGEFNYNIMHGPMDLNQAVVQFFNRRKVYYDEKGEVIKEMPKHGIFVDIDVFCEDLGEIKNEDLYKKAERMIDLGRGKIDFINNEVFNNIK